MYPWTYYFTLRISLKAVQSWSDIFNARVVIYSYILAIF